MQKAKLIRIAGKLNYIRFKINKKEIWMNCSSTIKDYAKKYLILGEIVNVTYEKNGEEYFINEIEQMDNKKIKVTKKLFRILKAYTKLFSRIEKDYYKKIDNLEKMMQQETGIKNIAFYFCDGEFAGIGTPACPDKMDLIDRYKLEGK